MIKLSGDMPTLFKHFVFPLIIFSISLFNSSCTSRGLQDSGYQTRPNILFIAVDDLKPSLGCYGDSLAITPNIDQLAEGGVTFMLNFCQQALCAPSRASLLTGRYPDQLKVWDLQTLIREKNPGIVTLPQYFRDHGYNTAATGKIFDPRSLEGSWNGPHDSLSWTIPYVPPGQIDTYNSEFGRPVYFYAGVETKKKILTLREEAARSGITLPAEIDSYIKKNHFPAVEDADVPFDAYTDGALSRHGIRLMDSLSEMNSPFFLAVGFNRPHLPFVSPKKYWDLYDRDQFRIAAFREPATNSPVMAYHNSGELRSGYTGIPQEGELPAAMQLELIHGYYSACSYIDDMIGMLLAHLEDLHIAENTIVVLWGDHGWHLGDHGLWCKHSNFEQATRTPLIIRYPQHMAMGARYYGPTEFTDIAPTLCDFAGIPVPDYFEGVSLRPVWDNPKTIIRTSALSQYPRGGLKYMGYSIRTEQFRYTKWIETSTGKSTERELYNYFADPLETKNLIDEVQYDSAIMSLDSLLVRRIESPSVKNAF
jgi:arylsulfatase A-like enzyme